MTDILIEDVTASVDAAKQFVDDCLVYAEICEDLETEIAKRNGTSKDCPLVIAELGPDAQDVLERVVKARNFTIDRFVQFARLSRRRKEFSLYIKLTSEIVRKNTVDVTI